MNDLTLSVIVILVTGLFVFFILVLSSRKKKVRDEAIKQMAASHGWRYERINDPACEGYAILGTDWRFESKTSKNSNQSEHASVSENFSTSWSTASVRSTDGLILIGPKIPSIDVGGFGNFLLQQALRLFLQDEADQVNEISEVHWDRPAIEKKISVWASSEEAALRFLTFNVENALLNWKLRQLPVVKISNKGVSITLMNGAAHTPEEVMAVIELGLTFLRC